MGISATSIVELDYKACVSSSDFDGHLLLLSFSGPFAVRSGSMTDESREGSSRRSASGVVPRFNASPFL